jgi:hypothetical protein
MTPLVAATAALWILAGSRLGPCLRQRGDLVFFAALSGAAATTLMAPGVTEAVFGSQSAATPAIGSLVMLAIWFVRAAVVRAVVDPENQAIVLRRGLLQTAAAITAYCVSFGCAVLVGAVRTEGVALDPTSRVDVGMLVFTATLSVYVLVGAVQIALVCVRYLPQMESRLFRAGFTTVVLACALAVIGMVTSLLHEAIGLASVGLDARPTLETAGAWLVGAAAALLPLGLVLPSLARRAEAWQVQQRYCLLRLDRVWRRAAQADLFFDTVAAPVRGAFSQDPRSRLHRALVEILDSQLASGGTLLTTSETRLVKKSEEAFYA